MSRDTDIALNYDTFRSLSLSEQKAFLDSLSPEELQQLEYLWSFWARAKQRWPEGDWRTWLILAGRGWGKTRCGCEAVREAVEKRGYRRIGIIAPTAADVRDVAIEGESGLLAISPPWNRPQYEPSKRRLTWLNGAVASLFSADEPDRLRGPQFDLIWCDELAAWRRPETWDNAMLALRLGTDPRVIVTTTPRPTLIVRELVAAETTYLVRGSTFENSDNLAAPFLNKILAKYEGTRIGRQELHAEILQDVEGALWTWGMVGAARLNGRALPEMQRIVVSIDPAVSTGENADDTGIIICGLGEDDRGYVLKDASGRYSPNEWARKALSLYYELGADRIVAEKNNGGDMVENTVRTIDRSASFKAVWASKGKQTRAEPVSALYEQGRVSHVEEFERLEEELTSWVPGMKSPDRLDALVWGFTELMLKTKPKPDWSNARAFIPRV